MKPTLSEYRNGKLVKRHAVTEMKGATALYRQLAAAGKELLLECDGIICACTWDVSRRKDQIMSIRRKRPVYMPKAVAMHVP